MLSKLKSKVRSARERIDRTKKKHAYRIDFWTNRITQVACNAATIAIAIAVSDKLAQGRAAGMLWTVGRRVFTQEIIKAAYRDGGYQLFTRAAPVVKQFFRDKFKEHSERKTPVTPKKNMRKGSALPTIGPTSRAGMKQRC